MQPEEVARVLRAIHCSINQAAKDVEAFQDVLADNFLTSVLNQNISEEEAFRLKTVAALMATLQYAAALSQSLRLLGKSDSERL